MRRPTPLAVVAAAAALAGVRARTARAGTGLSGADLHGRTAVVTGAGSGIGRALALLLARRGAFVHVADLDAGRAQAVTHQILDCGGQAVTHTVDVSDAAAVDALAEQVAQPAESTCCSTTPASGTRATLRTRRSRTGSASSTSTSWASCTAYTPLCPCC